MVGACTQRLAIGDEAATMRGGARGERGSAGSDEERREARLQRQQARGQAGRRAADETSSGRGLRVFFVG